MAKNCQPPVRAGKRLIFRIWRKCPKTGKYLYAPHYGVRAWPIWVDDDLAVY